MSKPCQYDLSKFKHKRYLIADDLPFWKDSDGNTRCRWCGGIVPRGRYRWCSKECNDEYLIRAFGIVLTHETFKRDDGICADCGLDTKPIKELVRELRGSYFVSNGKGGGSFHNNADWYLDKVGIKYDDHHNLWNAHHVVAVKDGGGCCGLDNIVTVCLGCHYKRHTGERTNIIPPLTHKIRIEGLQLQLALEVAE